MFMELFVYELVTGIAPLIGIKLVADKRYLKTINKPKSTPIDGQLKHYVGPTTKTERFMARNITKAIHNLTKYKAFQSLIILVARYAQKKGVQHASIQ